MLTYLLKLQSLQYTHFWCSNLSMCSRSAIQTKTIV